MTIELLKIDILSNNIPRFLIFVQREQELQHQYIDQISETLGLPKKFYSDANQMIYDITTGLADDQLYLLYDIKNTSDKLLDTLKSYKQNIIVIVDDTTPSTNKFANNVVEFNKLDELTLLSYALKICKDAKIQVEQDKLLELVRCCDCNVGILKNELGKIVTLGQQNSNILFDYMMQNGFSDYRETTSDSIINKIMTYDSTVFDDIYKVSDSQVGMFIRLYNTQRYKFLQTRKVYFMRVMKLAFVYYSKVMELRSNDSNAFKMFLLELFYEDCDIFR